MKYTLENSGMTVEASFSEANVRDIFLPLLERLTALQRRKGSRALVLLAAPPGAGKSTLAAFLRHLSLNTPEVCPLTALGMDGFHRRQTYLVSHNIVRDGEIVPMVRIKGAPLTFDLEHLRDAIARVAAGERCGWPYYDRRLHDPVPNALLVEGDLVLVEGNYLLLDEPGWRELRRFADYTIAIDADPQYLRGRLIARHIDGGKTPEAAERMVDKSDMVNIRLCLGHSLSADLRLRLRDDDTFEVL